MARGFTSRSPTPSPSIASSTTPRLLRSSPTVTVTLSPPHAPWSIYTTGSTISGTATIVLPPSSSPGLPFDSIEIALLGIARTRTDAVQFQRQASRVFLRMSMPASTLAAAYPVPRVLEPGMRLELPFEFVVPAQLTISSCEHCVKEDAVRAAHLSLPPTMGFWGSLSPIPSFMPSDDMAPEMAQVEYCIKATVLSQPDLGKKPERLVSGVHPIRVLPVPSVPSSMPSSLPPSLYTTTHTKTLRKGLLPLSPKIGRLTASVPLLDPVYISPIAGSVSSSTALATVNLSYTPSSSSPSPFSSLAPTIRAVSAKISASTYFGSSPMDEIPGTRALGHADFATSDVTVYSSSISLEGGFEMASPWTFPRRDSGYESDIPPKTHLTSTLSLPISLPTHKRVFLPTFHSCLISRIYTLHLAISASIPGVSAAVTLKLTLPLSIVVAPTYLQTGYDCEGLPTFETAMAEREADERLRPRVIRAGGELGGIESRGMLPAYDAVVVVRA